MKYRAILAKLQKMTPKQLNQNAVVYDSNNSYFPDGKVRIARLDSCDLDDARRDGMVLDDNQIVIKF